MCLLYVLPLLEFIIVAVSIHAQRQVANSFLEFCRAGPRSQDEDGLIFIFDYELQGMDCGCEYSERCLQRDCERTKPSAR